MKIGDKIRVIKTDSMFFKAGDTGLIVEKDDGTWAEDGDFWVVFDGGNSDYPCCIGPALSHYDGAWQFEIIEEA